MAVIGAGVAVDVQGGGGGRIGGHPILAKLCGPAFAVASGGEEFDFPAQGFGFGTAVDP
jgi:hypothetical protein